MRPRHQRLSVSGRVVDAETGAPIAGVEGAKLPESLRVDLVPADRADADDGARHFETWAGDDGAFSFVNLAPGRYFALVREGADHGREVTLGRCEDLAGINIEWPASAK